MTVVDPLEIQTWTVEEIARAIRRLMPEGAELKYEFRSEGFYEVVITTAEEELCSERNIDLRLALLNAFGELWLQTAPSDPRWRISDRKPGPPKQHAVRAEDPEDLDPDIVTSVYRSNR